MLMVDSFATALCKPSHLLTAQLEYSVLGSAWNHSNILRSISIAMVGRYCQRSTIRASD